LPTITFTAPLWLLSLTKKVYNFGSETDLGGGILSTFVFLLAVTVQVTHW